MEAQAARKKDNKGEVEEAAAMRVNAYSDAEAPGGDHECNIPCYECKSLCDISCVRLMK